MSAKPASTTAYQATLSQTFYTAPIAPGTLHDLVPENDRAKAKGILASTTWLKGSFSTEAEVAANQNEAIGARHSRPAPADDSSARMMRLGLTGLSGPVRYGLRYRTAGHDFYNGPDQALKELWSEWKQGPATWRSAIGQQWNNVEGNSARPRVEQSYGRLGLSLGKPLWPNLDLTFSKSALGSTVDPTGVEPKRKNTQTFEAGVGFTGALWQGRLSSIYSLETDLVRNGDHRVKSDTVTASFHPLHALSIAPTLGYRAEQQPWSGVRIDSPFLSVAMNYQQSRRLLITALGNVSETRSNDRVIEVETVGGKGVVAWDLQQSRDWKALLSVEGGYNRQLNLTAPSAPIEDLSGMLRLSVAPL